MDREYTQCVSTQDLVRRIAPRVQAIVCRDGRLLMAKHQEQGTAYWCLPGGGLEAGENPEEGALRELREEAGVEGRIVRSLRHALDARGTGFHTYLVEIGDQQPALGRDPELDPGAAILVDLRWLSLKEMPERDRAFLWDAGLMNVPGFLEEVAGWGEAVSYPC